MFGRPKSEIELLKVSLQGSTQALEVLVGRYQSLVCAITYGSTGSVKKSEELAQESFLRAWKSLGQFRTSPSSGRGAGIGADDSRARCPRHERARPSWPLHERALTETVCP